MIACSVTASTAETFWRSPAGLARFEEMVRQDMAEQEQTPLDVQAKQALNSALIGAPFRPDAEVDAGVQRAASATSARHNAASARAIRYGKLSTEPPPSRPAVLAGSADRAALHDSVAMPAPASVPDGRFSAFLRQMAVQRTGC